MNSLNAQIILYKTALSYQKQQETFSRKEIQKKIAEIKYLSSQKKIPKLTLRKEITHLEQKMDALFELEKSVLKQKKHESSKITSLKRQNKALQQRLAASHDKDLQHKVGKLSHLLGECLAKRESSKDIALAKKVLDEKIQPKPEGTGLTKLRALQHRINLLKHELEINKHVKDKDPKLMEALENKIKLIETKLAGYQSTGEVRHKVVLAPGKLSKEDLKNLQREVPLPPPPRMIEV